MNLCVVCGNTMSWRLKKLVEMETGLYIHKKCVNIVIDKAMKQRADGEER